MKAGQGVEHDGQTALDPTQAKLKEAQLTLSGWINHATDEFALLHNELTQFMTPQGGDGHRQQQPFQAFRMLQPGVVNIKAAGLVVSEALLNGLITNDKFCITREVRLKLSWWRKPLKERVDTADAVQSCGGKNETRMAEAASADRASRCPAALGSGLPDVADVDSGFRDVQSRPSANSSTFSGGQR